MHMANTIDWTKRSATYSLYNVNRFLILLNCRYGDIVWAKAAGNFPFWPARIFDPDSSYMPDYLKLSKSCPYAVVFYGDGTYSSASSKTLKEFLGEGYVLVVLGVSFRALISTQYSGMTMHCVVSRKYLPSIPSYSLQLCVPPMPISLGPKE